MIAICLRLKVEDSGKYKVVIDGKPGSKQTLPFIGKVVSIESAYSVAKPMLVEIKSDGGPRLFMDGGNL